MTIRRAVDLAALSNAYSDFEAGVDAAPEGSFSMSRNLKFEIGDATDDLIRMVQRLGLKVNNCDGAREIEALLYGWVRDANRDNPEFELTELFGTSIDVRDEPREKVINQFEADYHRLHPEDNDLVDDSEERFAGADAPFVGTEA